MTALTTSTEPAAARHFEPSPHRRPTRRWMTVFGGLLAAVVLAAGVLTYVGVRTVRESRAGRSVSTVTDPRAPGFEAFLEPTPTLLLAHADGSTLLSVAVLALSSGDAGGSVLLVPPATRINEDETAFTLGAVSAFNGGPEAIRTGLQHLLGFGLFEVAVVDDARWAALVEPVAPLAIDNPDEVGLFPAGPIELTADQVGPYLAARRDGESDLERMYRQQVFFEAWATAIAASTDAEVVPGEVDSGIGRFVRGLAGGPRTIASLPVAESPIEGGTRLDIDTDAARELLAEVVVFPTASRPGARTRIRLLDGTGDPQHVIAAAPLVVPAGAEIVVVGNAERFDYVETEVRYHTPVAKAAAEELRDALDAGRVVDDPRQTDAFDVTIVLGPDV